MAQFAGENYLTVTRSPMVISLSTEQPEKTRSVFLDVKATPLRAAYENNRVGPIPPGQPRGAFGYGNNHQAMEDVTYENIKPVLSILRVMGVMPITRPIPGYTTFVAASPAMAYSFIFFVALMIYVGHVAVIRMEIVRTLEGRFEEAVIAYLFLVNMLPSILVPILWHESKKIAEVLNSWSDFELSYRKVSGRALPMNLYNTALGIAIVIPIMSTASVVVTHVTMVHFQFLQVVPYCFLDTLTYMMGAYWYLMCGTLSSSAAVLAEDFQQALRHIGPAALVADYRALWLRLSKITRDTGTATCYTFTFINLYLFLIITLSIYGLMSQISEGFGIKDIGLAVTACCSVCLLFFICDEAHYASQNVRTNFQKKLLMVELSWMNNDAQTEINMFLRATEMNPSNISLGGFFDVNRNLFKSLLATMVTYLVVLLQFQISIPSEAEPPTNMDNITMVTAM